MGHTSLAQLDESLAAFRAAAKASIVPLVDSPPTGTGRCLTGSSELCMTQTKDTGENRNWTDQSQFLFLGDKLYVSLERAQ